MNQIRPSQPRNLSRTLLPVGVVLALFGVLTTVTTPLTAQWEKQRLDQIKLTPFDEVMTLPVGSKVAVDGFARSGLYGCSYLPTHIEQAPFSRPKFSRLRIEALSQNLSSEPIPLKIDASNVEIRPVIPCTASYGFYGSWVENKMEPWSVIVMGTRIKEGVSVDVFILGSWEDFKRFHTINPWPFVAAGMGCLLAGLVLIGYSVRAMRRHAPLSSSHAPKPTTGT